jgi:hypothetical protein
MAGGGFRSASLVVEARAELPATWQTPPRPLVAAGFGVISES